MDWLGLKDRVAVVTGGGLGIGRACCDALAAAGAGVVVADINEAAGSQTAEEIGRLHDVRAVFVRVDVSNKGSVDAMVGAVLDFFGRMDILVNNAGVLIPRLLVDPAGREELTEDVWDKVVAINQKGAYLCAQAVAREMIRRGTGGVIINMTSESGLEGSEGQSVYAATKGALYSLTRSWAKELGRHRIRVVGLAPGVLEATALRSAGYERALAYTRGITVEKLRESYEKVSIPLGRAGKLSEVADAVCFLASDRASYMHGTTMNLSGGKSRG
jgi:sorbitol-6-phosphate 2-dehydrogenase